MSVNYSTLTKNGSEWGEQAALFLWRAKHVGRLPVLRWLHAINNQGHGDEVRGARNKAVGVTPGVSDVFLPVTCRQYAGLYIEMKKTKGGTASGVQKEFIQYADSQGYRCVIAHGYREAVAAVLDYLTVTGHVQDPAQFAPLD